MLETRVLRFLIIVGIVNGVTCTAAPGIILARAGGYEQPVGRLIWCAAVVAVSLTPVQAAAMWLVVRPRVTAVLLLRRSREQIEQVLAAEAVDIAFQPIIDLQRGRLVGAEALSRFPSLPERSPDAWFAAAREIDRCLELEELAIGKALMRAFNLPLDCYVAVNVSPAMLVSGRLMSLIAGSAFPLSRIVVEVTEQTSFADTELAVAAREQLRAAGVRVAVDDAGSGYASLQQILCLRPDLIKIDRSLISGVDRDQAREALVSAVAMFALQSGAKVVAEGVETEAELGTLRRLGIEHAQGYFIGRPDVDISALASWRRPASPPRPRRAVYVIPPVQ
jgi:EAL domain-containing protein (putative c-di-GMP-specific phosphodiesterase class I)